MALGGEKVEEVERFLIFFKLTEFCCDEDVASLEVVLGQQLLKRLSEVPLVAVHVSCVKQAITSR